MCCQCVANVLQMCCRCVANVLYLAHHDAEHFHNTYVLCSSFKGLDLSSSSFHSPPHKHLHNLYVLCSSSKGLELSSSSCHSPNMPTSPNVSVVQVMWLETSFSSCHSPQIARCVRMESQGRSVCGTCTRAAPGADADC